MKMQLRADRQTLVVGGSLLVLLVVVLASIACFWSLRRDFVAEIDAIEPRTSRLLGILASADELRAASEASSGKLRELAYPGDQDSAATAAAMQQQVRELMTIVGLTVSGSQILPPRASPQFERLRLDITAEGNIEDFDEVLASLESMRPLVFVESLKVTPQRDRNRARTPQAAVLGDADTRKLTARFQLFALRLKD